MKTVGRVGLDGKRRVSLAKAIPSLKSLVGDDLDNVLFKVEIDEVGRIVLTPEIPVPAHEAWLFQNPAALASVLRGLNDAEKGLVVDRGSFAQHADEQID